MKLLPEVLAEYVETSLSPEEIGDLLTMVGFELEEILDVEGEPVLDVNIMANRGDAASVLGLAREVQAKVGGATDRFRDYGSPYRGEAKGEESSRIQLASPLCSRFGLLEIPLVQNGPSPEWLQKRLRRMGQRPISLLVDLTNYVMLELGQPMHAYDADRLETGAFSVRAARSGEMLTTLDGVERQMRGGELLIAEGEGERRAVGIAGIMGGQDTEVHAGTTRAVIEAARFDARSVRATRKAHGLFTEASYRFEREVDANLVGHAFRRFAELYEQATGEALDGGRFEESVRPDESRVPIHRLRPKRASSLLGYGVDRERCEEILRALGFEVLDPNMAKMQAPFAAEVAAANEVGALAVLAPSWRFDIAREDDLVEEIGRINGYEKIPALLPQGTTQPGGLRGYELWREMVRSAAIAEGFTQVIGHSLIAGGALMSLGVPEIGPRVVASPEHRVLRSSLWPSLAMAARRNGSRDVHLFEMGRIFSDRAFLDENNKAVSEADCIAFFSQGDLNPLGMKAKAGDQADFYTMAGVMARLAEKMGVDPLDFEASDEGSHFGPDLRLHPTRQAAISDLDGYCLFGRIGQIHPDVAKAEGLPPDTILGEINLQEAFYGCASHRQRATLSRHPAIRRDLAVVVPQDVPFVKIESGIRACTRSILEKLWVFDVYEGPNVGEGMKSIGVAVVLRKPDGTFTDEEANRVRDEIARGLEPLGATLRVG